MEININNAVQAAAAEFGTPLYLYFPERIEQRISRLREACSGMGIRYAVKSNPNPWLLRWFKNRIDSLDVSSSGELRLATEAGWTGDQLEFTGPAKTESDLMAALAVRVKSIVVEDISEARTLERICHESGQNARILVRIAPKLPENNFGVRLAGRVTQFGVDEERLFDFIEQARQLERVTIDGFHIYSGSQCLDDEAMAEHFRAMWDLFKRAIHMLDTPISELVFGAGMGIPYHQGDRSLTLNSLQPAVEKIQAEIAELEFPVKSFVEIGRFLVGEAGVFVTGVVRVKESLGSKIVLCDGGMNHNLGACGHLGGAAHRHYQMYLLPQQAIETGEARFTYRVVGPLCTAIDTLARNIDLPEVRENDLIVVTCSGSYGPSASPLFFISHKFPYEVVCGEEQNTFQDISWLGQRIEKT